MIKNYGIMFLVLMLWCVAMPTILGSAPKEDCQPESGESTKEESYLEDRPTLAPVTLKVYIEDSNTQKYMEAEEYVACALTAVMPDNAPTEAMKAQAIAIRSLIMHNLENPRHEGYDLCGDPFHCYALAEEATDKALTATEETAGEVLYYEGGAILGLSHLSSCIATESYGDTYPYLSGVPVRSEKEYACYKTVYSFTPEELAAIFASYNVSLTGDMDTWVRDYSFTEASRVKTVSIGGVEFKGSTVAGLLKLDSLCFSAAADGGKLNFTCYGSGSGYGLSRCSAMIMAREGMTAPDILKYFYPGTVLK